MGQTPKDFDFFRPSCRYSAQKNTVMVSAIEELTRKYKNG